MRSIRQNIRTAVLTKTKVRIFPYGTNNWLIGALLCSYHEVVIKIFGELSEIFGKTDEISLEAQFCENQTQNIMTKNFKNFWEIFGDC